MARKRAKRKRSESRIGLGSAFRFAFGLLLGAVLLLFALSFLGLLEQRRDRVPEAEEPRLYTALLLEETEGRSGVVEFLQRLGTRFSRLAERLPSGAQAGKRQGLAARQVAEEPVLVYLANGCGVDGLAGSLRGYFMAAGFDVCGVSNADRFGYGETLVVDRSGRAGAAEKVLEFLRSHWGVGRLIRQVRRPHQTDVLVVLGSDIAEARKRRLD